MADDRRAVESAVGDVARDLVGQRRDDWPCAIAARRLAGEARDLDEMVAIARHRRDRRAPDLARAVRPGIRITSGPRPRTSTEKRVGSKRCARGRRAGEAPARAAAENGSVRRFDLRPPRLDKFERRLTFV